MASLVVASSQPRVVLSSSRDRRAFDEALAAVEVGGGAADFAGAFTLAESLETPEAPTGFVLVSDGGMSDVERRLIPPGTRYVRIGARSDNGAVTRLAVEPRGSGLHARVTVRNTGRQKQRRLLRVDVDGRTAASVRLALAPGATVQRELDLPGGDRVEAALEGVDLLGSDDRAFAAVGRRREIRVLLAGPANLYLERLLGAIPGVRMERSDQARPGRGFDLAVYAGVDVPADPAAPFLAVAPPRGAPGVGVQGEVRNPIVALVRSEDSWLRDLDLSDIAIARAQRVDAPGDEVLIASEGAPLLLRGSRGGRPFAYLSFRLEESNLPLQVAFPILGDRVLASLTQAGAPPGDVRTGQTLPLTEGAVTVHGPGGTRQEVPPGAPAPIAGRPGFWVVKQKGRADRLVAVNADPRESFLGPVKRLPVRPRSSRPGERRPGGEVPLLPWVAVALIALLAVELWVSRRTSGVTRRQWRAALVLRGVAVGLLILVLVGAGIPRPGRRVATVFLVDASDSMGAAGRQAAFEWVRAALRRQPAGALAGVAQFGADARLELTMQGSAELVQPAAKVDGSATDLANALRLAAAVLPDDSRRRVVVVSDGRITSGDARAEVRRLRAEGIRVDVRPIALTAGGDVAVARLDAPTVVRQREAYALQATISATEPGVVRLTLSRDGEPAGELTRQIDPGETVVDLPQPPGEPGVQRFRLEVSGPANAVPQNDVAFAGVRVEGPARVLAAEGSPGAARELVAALRAAGLPVDVIRAVELPPLDRLATYESTVLVDVDAGSLSGEQVGALAAATRDLGRGLVVIGGDRSFALGGYLGSELEKLLPVVSEIKDPKRRASVAEVLAIDTSGSMGACHCNGGADGLVTGANGGGGGINKTDISRAAAARAIRALSANDQVGVLAFNTEQRWVVPLQQLPAEKVVERGLRGLTPAGGTNLHEPLRVAGEALRAARAKLKHIIVFTDGWTNQEGLAEQAAALAEEGITVSVLATGEGPGEELERVAQAGRGRFYLGRDLSRIPQILMQEVALAGRQFVNEGEFYPKVASDAPPVRTLAESPPVLGPRPPSRPPPPCSRWARSTTRCSPPGGPGSAGPLPGPATPRPDGRSAGPAGRATRISGRRL